MVGVLCKICSKSFTKKCNLTRHIGNVHTNKQPDKKRFICHLCNDGFNEKYNLIRHITTWHVNPRKALPKIKCILCNIECDKKAMLEHYNTQHDIDISTITMEFECFSAFENWKSGMENDTNSFYVKCRTKKVDKKVTYFYRCHRDGFYKAGGNNLRRLKLLGSNKINGYCPSYMNVKVPVSGKVSIEMCKSHVGHEMDIDRLPLFKSEQNHTAEKMGQRVSFDEVLDSIRDAISMNELERRHLLTQKDLLNIESLYELNNNSNCATVDDWVKETRDDSSDTVVRIHKRQGKSNPRFPTLQNQDFLLVIMNDRQLEMLKKYGNDCICIDSTYRSSNFELTTLLILDDLRRGFPCTFILSNVTNATILETVFDTIKNNCENTIKPQVLMSNQSDVFYNAWCVTMGSVPHRLFCSWQVDEAWRKNIQEKIENYYKQKTTYKIIRTLMEERDKIAFESLLTRAMETMIEDADLRAFGEYFKTFETNKQLWAYCYRLEATLSNMNFERMHRTLNYIFIKGDSVKRLDKPINAVMKFVRDKLLNRVIILDAGNVTKILSDLKKQHATSVHLQRNTWISNEREHWILTSTSGEESYRIENANVSCNCDSRCAECTFCIHAFVCTCPDSSVRWNMCKHIHYICHSLKMNGVSPVTALNVKKEITEDV